MIYAENILICIAVPLVIALMFLRGGGRKFVVTFLLGMVVCLLSAYMSGFCQNVFDLSAEETSVFISPITEECSISTSSRPRAKRFYSYLSESVQDSRPLRTHAIFSQADRRASITFL